MDDETKKNTDDNSGDSFDYEDLINEFSSKSDEEGNILEGLDIENLIKDAGRNTIVPSSKPSDNKNTDAGLTDIFDNLDDLARVSILEKAPSPEEADDEGKSEENEETEEEQYSFGGISLDDDSEGGYASLLSQLEKKDSSKQKPLYADIDEKNEDLDDYAIDLELFGDTVDNDNKEKVGATGDEVSGESGISFDFESIEELSSEESSTETAEISFDLNALGEGDNDSAEESEPGNEEEHTGGGDTTDESEIDAALYMETGEESEGKIKTDIEAVEGVITGEFSIDDVSLSDIGMKKAKEEASIRSDITSEHSAYTDEADEEDDAIPPDMLHKIELSDESDEASPYAAALAGFGEEESGGESPADIPESADAVMDGFEIEGGGEDGVVVLSFDSDEPAEVNAEEPEEEAAGAATGEFDFSDEDLFASDEPEEEKPLTVQQKAEEKAAEEDDFLGLSSVASSSSESGGRFGGTVEVLFEGVEMDYDDQVAMVTLAEVLLAQKKKDKAEALYKKVVDRKGSTHWVARRLDQLLGISEE